MLSLCTPFHKKKAFSDHFPNCSKHVRQQVVYPEKDKSTLDWRPRNKTELCSHLIRRFRKLLVLGRTRESRIKRVIDEHIPSGFCTYTVSKDPQYPNTYSGADCMEIFFDRLMREQTCIANSEEKKT